MNATTLEAIDWTRIRLNQDNSKLGSIATWSLPAGSTCPGATAICASKCYAKRGHFAYKAPKAAFQRNLEAVMSDPRKWYDVMHGELSKLPDGHLVRIHVSGDFFANNYTSMWSLLATAFPRLYFGTYTRSWSRDDLSPALEFMAQLPNVTLWPSIDRDSYLEYIAKGLPLDRCAVMMLPGEEYIVQALLGTGMDSRRIIVFRTSRRDFIKQVAGAVVCPIEQSNPLLAIHGKQPEPGQVVMNCSKCRLCYDKSPGKRMKV